MAKDDRKIYLLNPKNLNPETIAVTFAKTSRSPQSFSEIASELTDEKSAQFHEKWVVGYGHASVAEHAVLHIAIENVSRLAIETIESNRLAAYTEKSTRYQKWDRDSYFIPDELKNHDLLPLYIDAVQRLFDTYHASLEAVKPVISQENPRGAAESEAAWERRIRSKYIDICRYLLPAASLANVGMTANARVLEHAIQKLLSSPLSEVQEIGKEVKHVSQAEIPTLVKYADRVAYLETVGPCLAEIGSAFTENNNKDWCQLSAWDPSGEDRILAAALYRFGKMDFEACTSFIQKAGVEEKQKLASILVGTVGEHDIPLRELEHAVYTFDVVMDQGAYFEVKRHRMMTQTPQALTTCLGYAVPRAICQAGFEDSYRQAMEQAARTFQQLHAWNPGVASYVVPNGFNRRVLMTLNLREAFHFCSLRASDRAHFSVRRVARCMAEQIQAVHPLLGAYIAVSPEETWQDIESNYFAAV